MKLPHSLIDRTEWTILGPMGPELPSYLANHPVIGVDGGAQYARKLDVWIGDGDSRGEEVTEAETLFRLPAEKDHSDLAAALALFTESRHYKFHLWGFLGGRRDHELFNLGETLSYLKDHPESEALFYNEQGRVIFHLLGEGDWKFHHQGLFSVGTHQKTTLMITGSCDYQLKKETVLPPLSSLGLSNQGYGDVFIRNRGPIFLYFPGGR